MSAIQFVGTARDWLDVRIPLPFSDAFSWLGLNLGQDDPLELVEAPAKTGYARAAKPADRENFGKLTLLGGHPAALGWSMLQASGGSAPWAHSAVDNSPFAKSAQVNRVDVALDFLCSQSKFDALFKAGRAICQQFDRRPHPVGEAAYGRTLYFNWKGRAQGLTASANAKAPQYSARLYEKGKEQGQNPDWRRFEVTCRPDKPATKERAFHLDVEQILSAAPWSRAFLAVLGYEQGRTPPRASPMTVEQSGSREAKEARAMWAMSHLGEQYGKSARELAAMIGQDEVLELVRAALFQEAVEGSDDAPARLSGVDVIRQNARRKYAGLYAEQLRQDFAAAPVSWGLRGSNGQGNSGAQAQAEADKFAVSVDFWRRRRVGSAVASQRERRQLL